MNFQEGLSCGGAYVKLLVDSPDLVSHVTSCDPHVMSCDLPQKLFNDKSPYSIMFGPDKCGMSSKVRNLLCIIHTIHFIYTHTHTHTHAHMHTHTCTRTRTQVHMIVQFKNPVTGKIEEKHSKQSSESMAFFDDKKTHLFTLCEWSSNSC